MTSAFGLDCSTCTSRPGVAIITYTPLSKAMFCCSISEPPTKSVPYNPNTALRILNYSLIWYASSRVGAMIREWKYSGFCCRLFRIGKTNVSVFPVAVGLMTAQSLPFSICGIACFCIGVGSVI